MNTLVNVARYHLVDRLTYAGAALGDHGLQLPGQPGHRRGAAGSPEGDYTGGLVTIYVFLLICGVLSMTRSLPFGLMLGVSRRTYYLGTALLDAALGVVYGLGLTVLQAIERATGGWGLGCTSSGCRGSWTARGTRPG